MYTSRAHKKELITHDDYDPLIVAAWSSLREHGAGARERKTLDQWRFTYKEEHWSAAELVTSYPMLLRGMNGIDVESDIESLKELNRHYAQAQSMHHSRARGMIAVFSDRNARWESPRTRTIPKLAYDDDISISTLRSKFNSAEVSGLHIGDRTITIPAWQPMALAGSIQFMLLGYLRRWWKSEVVGFRPGIGSHQILAALRQALQATGRTHLLAADVSKFFDSVPLDKALNQLHALTGYRNDPDLARLVTVATQHEGRGLPQGNPLSPLLANIYAHYAIDKAAVRFGPCLRYADDVLILCQSRDEVTAAYTSLQAGMTEHELSLHSEKSRYWDLAAHKSYRLDTGAMVPEGLVYIGFDLHLSPQDGLAPRLGNRSVRRLLEGLRELRFNHVSPNLRLRFLTAIGRSRLRLIGWTQFFGATEWTAEQQEAIHSLRAAALLDTSTLQAALPAIARQIHSDPQSWPGFYADVGRAVGMPLDKETTEIPLEQVKVVGTDLGHLCRSARSRLIKAFASPPDLVWGDPCQCQHTIPSVLNSTARNSDATTPMCENGSIISLGEDDLPAPMGTIICRLGRHDGMDYPNFIPPVKLSS